MKSFLIVLSLLIGSLFLNSCTTQESTTEQNQTSVESGIAESFSAEPPQPGSPYKGNQLANGESPLDPCFGKGKYAGKAWIEFKNDNSSDVIVCLVNVNNGKIIRNEFIRAGADFKMSRIPRGTYYLKTYHGNDWNPTMKNFCGTNGAFESNVDYSTSDNPGDHIQVESSRNGYTTGSITLYAVRDGNMASSPLTEAEFFNN